MARLIARLRQLRDLMPAPTLRAATCAHCRNPVQGFVIANGKTLCHPYRGISCFRAVTDFGHHTPCTFESCARARNLNPPRSTAW